MPANRRELLIGGLQVTALWPTLSLRARSLPFHVDGERALVVVQLTGGNDALSMLVPHRQDAYFRARPTLALERDKLHAIDGEFGLHPEMAGLAELFAEGRAAAVHSVGITPPNRSHFRAMEIWHTADPEHPAGDTGWLGRAAEQLAGNDPLSVIALHIGAGELPLALRSRHAVPPSIESAESFAVRPLAAEVERARADLLELHGGADDLAFVRDAARAAYRTAARVQELANRPAKANYPDFGLARRLALVARLVAGNFGARVFYVTLDGFDTHARQANVHAALMRELSQSLAAFQRDLASHGADARVATLVFSEFGRRVEENGSKGTDHGSAAPVLLTGGALRGALHGTAPDLEHLDDGDLAVNTDFRAIYACVLRDWLGLPSESHGPALDLFAV